MMTVSGIEEFFELFKEQKAQLKQEKELRYTARIKQNKLKAKTLALNKTVVHSKPWNPSPKTLAVPLQGPPVKPNPDGRPFDAQGKEIWPVQPDRSCNEVYDSTTNTTKRRVIKTPWYRVQSGQLFNDIGPMNPQERTPVKKDCNWKTFYTATASGRLFNPITFSPTISELCRCTFNPYCLSYALLL